MLRIMLSKLTSRFILLIFLSGFFLLVTSCPGPPIDSGGGADPWKFVDGNFAAGINKNASLGAYCPQLTVFGTKLYAAWCEDNGTAQQIRVAVYNDNDNSSTWTFVDGNGTNGINKDATRSASDIQLRVFNSKLYVSWSEDNGTARQIRVAVYGGDDNAPTWTFVDGNGPIGINQSVLQDAYLGQLIVFNTKLYAVWMEANGIIFQTRVAVYNGNDSSPAWAFVDGSGVNGINKDVTRSAGLPALTVFSSKLYASWAESNGTADQIRVVVYNGNDSSPAWTFVDGNGINGINKDITKNADFPKLTTFSSKLYATWMEYNGTADQIRVVVYNGNDGSPAWTFVDGNTADGINKDKTQSAAALGPTLTVFNSQLYTTWAEVNSTLQIRVAVYNGNDSLSAWPFVDGNGRYGINKDFTRSAGNPRLTVFNSKLYAAWFEFNGTATQIRVVVKQ